MYSSNLDFLQKEFGIRINRSQIEQTKLLVTSSQTTSILNANIDDKTKIHSQQIRNAATAIDIADLVKYMPNCLHTTSISIEANFDLRYLLKALETPNTSSTQLKQSLNSSHHVRQKDSSNGKHNLEVLLLQWNEQQRVWIFPDNNHDLIITNNPVHTGDIFASCPSKYDLWSFEHHYDITEPTSGSIINKNKYLLWQTAFYSALNLLLKTALTSTTSTIPNTINKNTKDIASFYLLPSPQTTATSTIDTSNRQSNIGNFTVGFFKMLNNKSSTSADTAVSVDASTNANNTIATANDLSHSSTAANQTSNIIDDCYDYTAIVIGTSKKLLKRLYELNFTPQPMILNESDDIDRLSSDNSNNNHSHHHHKISSQGKLELHSKGYTVPIQNKQQMKIIADVLCEVYLSYITSTATYSKSKYFQLPRIMSENLSFRHSVHQTPLSISKMDCRHKFDEMNRINSRTNKKSDQSSSSGITYNSTDVGNNDPTVASDKDIDSTTVINTTTTSVTANKAHKVQLQGYIFPAALSTLLSILQLIATTTTTTNATANINVNKMSLILPTTISKRKRVKLSDDSNNSNNHKGATTNTNRNSTSSNSNSTTTTNTNTAKPSKLKFKNPLNVISTKAQTFQSSVNASISISTTTDSDNITDKNGGITTAATNNNTSNNKRIRHINNIDGDTDIGHENNSNSTNNNKEEPAIVMDKIMSLGTKKWLQSCKNDPSNKPFFLIKLDHSQQTHYDPFLYLSSFVNKYSSSNNSSNSSKNVSGTNSSRIAHPIIITAGTTDQVVTSSSTSTAASDINNTTATTAVFATVPPAIMNETVIESESTCNEIRWVMSTSAPLSPFTHSSFIPTNSLTQPQSLRQEQQPQQLRLKQIDDDNNNDNCDDINSSQGSEKKNKLKLLSSIDVEVRIGKKSQQDTIIKNQTVHTTDCIGVGNTKNDNVNSNDSSSKVYILRTQPKRAQLTMLSSHFTTDDDVKKEVV